MSGFRGEFAGLRGDFARLEPRLDRLEVRIERIERHLDLIDTTAAEWWGRSDLGSASRDSTSNPRNPRKAEPWAGFARWESGYNLG
jgi:hypothetical protein